MTEEKHNRVVAAVTVSVVLLIIILTAIVIYQLVIISSMNRHKRELETEITQLQEQTSAAEKNLEDLQSDWFLWQKLLEYGYHKA